VWSKTSQSVLGLPLRVQKIGPVFDIDARNRAGPSPKVRGIGNDYSLSLHEIVIIGPEGRGRDAPAAVGAPVEVRGTGRRVGEERAHD